MKRSPLSRRSRLRTRSAKKRAEREAAQVVVEAVFARDRGCLLYGTGHRDCFGPLTPHHLRKASQSGEWRDDNVVALCSGHNEWVEMFPNLAHALGLVVRNGETTSDAWERMRAAGLTEVVT